MANQTIEFRGNKTYRQRRDALAVEVYRFLRDCDGKGVRRMQALQMIREKYDVYSTATIYGYVRRGAQLLGEPVIDRREAKR